MNDLGTARFFVGLVLRRRDADHTALVDGLRDGLTDEEMSTRLDRTVNDIRQHAKVLLGPDHSRATGRVTMELLRQQIIEGTTFD